MGLDILTFAQTTVFDEASNEISLGQLWQNQTAIFIFLRHFACMACRSHAAQIWKDREKYQKVGAKIYFIGNGTPQFVRIFKEDLNIQEAPVFTDPSLDSFRAAGFRRGFLAALGPRALINGVRMMADGNKNTPYEKAAGDLWQLGGVAVIKRDGKVAYHYISEVLGDYPPEKDLSDQVN